MIKSKNCKYNFIIILILFLTLVIFNIIIINNLKYIFKDSNSIYCKSETSPTDKIEVYYDFKDGLVYKYTIVVTSPIKEDFDREKQEQFITAINLKYKGLISKVWYDDDTYTTTEVFDLDRLTETEMKDLTGISIKEFKNKSREELINTIIPISSSNFTCK